MKPMRILLAIILAFGLVALTALRVGLAEDAPQAGYSLTWMSLDNGGSVASTGTGYALSGSIAQPDAKTWASGHYTLQGGFWPGAILEPERYLYLPCINR
jgi:hypothetical protein